MNQPLQPLTKEAAATILTVSKRTIENWIADGTIPAPTSIGRRVYWHPETFYTWLEQKLRGQTATPAPLKTSRGRPRTQFIAHTTKQ